MQLSLCSPCDKLFSHEILLNNSRGKEFIAKSLSDHFGQRPINSKLLCKLDPLNSTNFHKYFDRIPNIMALAQLRNGRITAGFSKSAFDNSNKVSNDSLILSVTNEEVIKLRPGAKRSIVYD